MPSHGKDPPEPEDGDRLILVDEENRVRGPTSRTAAHEGEGVLHRAFSVFLFDPRGRVLLQQRAAGKALWPLAWSNSVCSHPRYGEDEEDAAVRRVGEELGLEVRLEYVYRFVYRARYEDVGSEYEHCGVYLGRTDAEVRPDRREVAAWRYARPADLDLEIQEDAARFTPWIRLEWARLRGDLRPRLAPYLSRPSGRLP